MADLLYIANAALDLVGQGNILSLDDSTVAAKKAKLHIAQAVREVLSLGKWKCAKKQANLALLTAAPITKWGYAFQLPSDFLRTVAFNDTDSDNVLRDLYDIQGKQLLCNATTAYLEYICDLTDPLNDISAAPPYLVELMGVKLAQKMSWGMQQSRTLKESLEQEYQQKRRVALATNAKETRDALVNPSSESTWARARFASTAG